MTVLEYEQQKIQELKKEVAPWPRTRPAIVSSVENKHGGLLTVDAVDVQSFTVRTYDGSQSIGNKGRNIQSATLVLRFWWDGLIHKNGHTDVAFLLVPSGDGFECRSTRIEETDAIIPDIDEALGVGLGFLGCLLLL